MAPSVILEIRSGFLGFFGKTELMSCEVIKELHKVSNFQLLPLVTILLTIVETLD